MHVVTVNEINKTLGITQWFVYREARSAFQHYEQHSQSFRRRSTHSYAGAQIKKRDSRVEVRWKGHACNQWGQTIKGEQNMTQTSEIKLHVQWDKMVYVFKESVIMYIVAVVTKPCISKKWNVQEREKTVWLISDTGMTKPRISMMFRRGGKKYHLTLLENFLCL